MNHAISKRFATLGAVTLCVLVGGCATGHPGFGQAKDGNFTAADASFTKEYQSNPDNAIVQFNMADTYMRRGDTEKANSLYRLAAASGKDVHPDDELEAHGSSSTTADAACLHLKQNNVSDVNCP